MKLFSFPVMIAAGAMALTGAVSCSSSRSNSASSEPAVTELKAGQANSRPQMMPRARAYKTSGDYRSNVPVNMNAAHTEIVSFPAPTDLSERSMPLQLAGGYLLDRRGIGENSVFTTYTYAEYMKLPSAPSMQQLMASIMPEAVVTEIVEFPFTTSEAEADTARCNSMLREHSSELKWLYSAPVLK